MPTFKLTLAYDGTDFFGWQIQPDRRTVQAVLEGAIARATGEPSRVSGASRTDAGVHACAQVASFRSSTRLAASVLQRAINAHLPDDVRVLRVEAVGDDFHALRAARSKRYRYVWCDAPVHDVFALRYAWHVRQALDAQRMHRAAQQLLGRRDFRSFQTAGSPRESTIRTVLDVRVFRPDPFPSQVWLEIEADGFLYNMVRAIAGTLRDVGRGRRPESWLGEIVAAADRRRAGMTAPPQGLFLLAVRYA
jgi:tRNA pseudouridine38-40 synthase